MVTSFQQLLDIVKTLRGPEGCPWDKEQTHKSLTPYAVEEALELEEAIHNEDMENMKEELGDLLFQSVLHSEIADQNGDFNIEDVLQHLNNKMVSRHPHVFSDTQVRNASEVVQNWEDIKAKEKKENPFHIPATFPSLLAAHKIGKRTRQMDFDWNTPEEVLKKIKEEVSELEEALEKKEPLKIQEELGDLLFTCSQLARHTDLDAEKALRLANKKFIGRFEGMRKREPNFKDIGRSEKEALWNQVKSEEKS
ncbi:MAG: nucleoside triphosphate pyrophosphohydrolase [Pseudomonadota bacterium]